MGAKSRFEQPLTLLNGGRQVVACGPLLFFGCDMLATVDISLIQPGKGAASAHGVFVNHHFNPDKCKELVGDPDDDDSNEWMLTANVRPQAMYAHTAAGWAAHVFVPAPPDNMVNASGVIRYRDNHGNVEMFQWTGDDLGGPLQVR